jgi:adenosylcobinamide-GDP ribazoletransferase
MQQARLGILNLWRSLLGAILFYTICPIPKGWQPSFHRIARWCPLLGVIMGGILAGCFWGLSLLGISPLLNGALLVSLWLGLTGGLHLDGAMDSADGLAVTDPERRLEVMADSATGAFGAMAGMIILLLKFAAIASMSVGQWWLFPFTLAWARWSQVTAIAFYPYLKAQGKGAFHKQDFNPKLDLFLSALPAIGLLILLLVTHHITALPLTLGAVAIANSISYWFNKQFTGHTGDTYGASIEWTECLLLSLGVIIPQ